MWLDFSKAAFGECECFVVAAHVGVVADDYWVVVWVVGVVFVVGYCFAGFFYEVFVCSFACEFEDFDGVGFGGGRGFAGVEGVVAFFEVVFYHT